MAYKNTRKNWGSLITAFNKNKEHFELANIALKGGIDVFCKLLQIENIAHANINSSGKVWGSKSLIKCFCETFDPIFLSIFPVESLTNENLRLNKTPLPLAEFLVEKESCREYADLIKDTVNDLEDLLTSLDTQIENQNANIDESKIIEDAENLELLASLLYAICNELENDDKLTWCSICFRRAPYNGKYCNLHSATNDTNYRKGLRIQAAIPKEIYSSFVKNRSKRKSLGDNFHLLSKSSDVPNTVTHHTNGIYVESIIKELVFNTKNKNWCDVFQDWDQFLKLMPNVAEIFNENANNFSNWDDFSRALSIELDNTYEHTKHPYWFFLMLVEAETWLSYEKILNDCRLTNNEDKIVDFISQGFNNAEIAVKVKVSRQYVGQVKKRNT